MSRLLVFIGLSILFLSCERGDKQIIGLINLSSGNVYFLASESDVISNPNEVANIRPLTSDPMPEMNVEYEDEEQAKSTRHNLYRNRIERDSVGKILTSESAGIFVNAVTIQSIIKDRYNGRLNIFIITESDLLKYSDQEITDGKKYKHIMTVTGADIKEDTVILEYH